MGIGGYGHHSGMAWRYEFTKEEQISFDINQKEYLASSINQKIQLTFDDSQFPCSEDITDNTSACAWMYKSNFDPSSHPVNNEIAHETAKTLMEHNASSYSQHLPGAANDIADSLSRAFHLTDKQLIALFEHTKPPYLPPQKMKIIKLPEELTSWIASLAQLTTKTRELKWARTKSTLAHGIIGWSGSTTSKPDLTPIFESSHVPKKIRCLCGFLHALRRGDFSPTGDQIKGKTAKTAIIHVAATISASGGKDPRLDKSGKPSLLIERQINSYKKVDPKTKHQKAIPPEVYRFILRRATLPRNQAVANLLCSALFFAMRSCEYSKTQRHHEKQTRTIRPCDITFIKGNKILSHDHPHLHKADIVIVTFGPQKSDAHRDKSIPQEATSDDELNPVWHMAHTIRRLRSYPGYDKEWPIYTYYDQKRNASQTSRVMK